MDENVKAKPTTDVADSKNNENNDDDCEIMEWSSCAHPAPNRERFLPTNNNNSIHGVSSVTSRPVRKSIVRDTRDDDFEPELWERDTILTNSHHATSGATGFRVNPSVDLDADAAYALKLQQEEYSRDTMLSRQQPTHSFSIIDERETATALDNQTNNNGANGMSDAEYAAYLQEQENQRVRRAPSPISLLRSQRRQNPPASQEPTTNGEPAFFPLQMPFRIPQRHNPDPDNDSDDDDHRLHPFHPFFELLSNRGQPMPNGMPPFFRFHMGGPRRRSGNLQDSADDFGPEDYERLLQLDDTVRKKKLTKEQINRISTEKYKRTLDNSDEENKCGVCLENYEDGDMLRRFPCKHLYHRDCADRWLTENNACPICREPPVHVSSRSDSRPRFGRGTTVHHDRSNYHRGASNGRTHHSRPNHHPRGSRNNQQS